MTTRHKWADVIHAYADGKKIQYRGLNAGDEADWLNTDNLLGIDSGMLEWRVAPSIFISVAEYKNGSLIPFTIDINVEDIGRKTSMIEQMPNFKRWVITWQPITEE